MTPDRRKEIEEAADINYPHPLQTIAFIDGAEWADRDWSNFTECESPSAAHEKMNEDEDKITQFKKERIELINAEKAIQVQKLVDRFLAWPLPKSVCSDLCVVNANYSHPRFGTNLLTADEAKKMIEYLLEVPPVLEGK